MRQSPRLKIFQKQSDVFLVFLFLQEFLPCFFFFFCYFFLLDGRRHCGKDAKLDELLSGLERNNHLLSMSFNSSLV